MRFNCIESCERYIINSEQDDEKRIKCETSIIEKKQQQDARKVGANNCIRVLGHHPQR